SLVRTEVTEGGAEGLVRREDFATSEGQDFVRGVRVAGINVPLGEHDVLVELLDSRGNVLAERLSRVTITATSIRTVVITRDCGGVACPLADGDPNTSCLGGVCVLPECTVETPELCPPSACSIDSDCPTPQSECAAPRCDEGVCFMLARNELCELSEWCNPEEGCQSTLMTDAGMSIDGGVDAGPDVTCGDCDDDNECTTDRCVAGACVNSPLADETACGVASMCMAGTCGCAGAGSVDTCNGLDDDCDGETDEDCGCFGERSVQVAQTRGNLGQQADLAVDIAGGLHASFRDASNNNLRYAYHPPSGYWTTEVIEEAGSVGRDVAVASDSSGGLHVLHWDTSNRDLRYAYRDPAGLWGSAVVDAPGTVGEHPAIALDAAGGVHASYSDGSANDLKYAYKPAGGLWQSEVAVSNGRGLHSSIAVAPDGRVFVSYRNSTSNSLDLAIRGVDGAWNNEVVDGAGNRGEYTSLQLDDAMGIHIAYHDVSARDLLYAYRAAGMSVYTLEVVDAESDKGRYADLDIDASGIVHIAYRDESANTVKHAQRRVGEAWVLENVDTVGNVGLELSMDTDSQGGVHISYYDASNQDLYYSYRAPGATAWLSEPVYAFRNSGRYTALAVGPDGGTHIVHQFASDHDLMHSYKPRGGVWRVQNAATMGSVGEHSSIALAPDGTPNIAFFDRSDSRLMHAVASADGWTLSEVDNTANVGYETSIVIDSAGTILIAYRDASANDLKLASKPVGETEWTLEAFDTAGSQGRYTAMRMDASGGVHLAWYDDSANDLRYAFRPLGDVFGAPTTVATTSNVGSWVSMATDLESGVHLAYNDGGAVGYAYRPADGLWTFDRPINGPSRGDYTAIAVDSRGDVHVASHDRTATTVGRITVIANDLSYARRPRGGEFASEDLETSGDVGKHAVMAAGPGGYVYLLHRESQTNDLRFVRICP
ncbi:MAG: hypothetical protein ACI9KE_003909, partial [Polyangiales bacterium]